MNLNTPIVLIIYKRPESTQLVFDKISEAKPTQLFVIADGPRVESESTLCEKARAILTQVDWPCDIKINYSDINLGCMQRVSSGLDWVFSQVESAIILEDDCLPNLSFFYFCQELLNYYQQDQRIWTISGNNFQDGIKRTDFSYFFSKYPLIWGWATWKRAWEHFDANLTSWSEEFALEIIQSVCEDEHEQQYRLHRFKDITQGRLDAWAPRWLFTCWANNGLSVIPEVNLVSNIGFGSQGTHTLNAKSKYANLKTYDLNVIRHPNMIYRNLVADKYMYDHFFHGLKNKKSRRPLNRVSRKLKSYFIF